MIVRVGSLQVDDFNEQRPNRHRRAQFDKWFSKKVQEAGAVVLRQR
jgi:electron transfer flavoprotein-quinone oxidoreductase